VTDKATRKELKAQYRENPPEAGVYRITNTATGRVLFGSSTNLPSVSNKLDFAKTTNLPGAMDQRLRKDIATHGIDAFTFDILEVLEPQPAQTSAELRADLAVLEALWREKLTGTDLY
jgi:hypothetical protein